MKPSHQYQKTLFLFGVPLFIFAFVVLAHLNQIPQMDSFRAINSSSVEVLGTRIWPSLTLLGDTLVLLCLLSPLFLINGRIVLALIAAIPVGGLSSVVLKHIFSAPRPADVIDPQTFHVLGGLLSGKSFPSGHSITAFAACGVVYACLISTRALQRTHWVVFSGTFFLAALVAVSRIAVGAHWPADVVAGACIGWLAGLSGAAMTQKFPKFFASTRTSWVSLWLLVAGAVSLLFREYSDPWSQVLNHLAGASVLFTLVTKTVAQLQFKYEWETSNTSHEIVA